LRSDYWRRLLGRSLQVLAESVEDGATGNLRGTSCRYAPVHFPAPAGQIGRLFTVRATRLDESPDLPHVAGEMLAVSPAG
jgi:hypothetical protein